MNDELIYLESDDEITAVIDRLRGTDAMAIRLVVPKGALVLQSLVSLKLLKRESKRLRKQIAVVTQDLIGQRLAREAQISVYSKPKDDRPIFAGEREIFKEIPGSDDAAETVESVPPEEIPPGLAVHHYTATDKIGSGTNNIEVEAQRGSEESQNFIKQALKPAFRVPKWGWRVAQISSIVILLGLVGYVVFIQFAPRAVINLVVATEALESTLAVNASTQSTQVDLATATIPARSVSAEVTVEQSAPTTGKKEVGLKATASLTLYNYWDANSQNIAVGTTFRASDGTLFITTAAASIPGATTTLREGQVVTTPGKSSVTIEASDPGPQANDKSGTFTIPSLAKVRQDKIYGESTGPTAGGTSEQVSVVAQGDLDNLKSNVTGAIASEGKAKLEELSQGYRLLDGALLITPKEETFSAVLDEQTDNLTYSAIVTVEGLVFVDDDLKIAAIEALKRSVPSARTAVLRDSDQLITTAKSLNLGGGTLEIQVVAQSHSALLIDSEALVETVTDQSVGEAEEKLRATAGVAEVKIDQRPSWLARMPKREDQIEIKLEYKVE